MKIIRSVKQMQQITLSLKNKKTIAVVPTMGALHEGHLSLVRLAQKKAQVVVATIFVNPMQFGKNEDFNRYPNNEKEDLEKLSRLRVDYVFLPKMTDIYPPDYQTHVTVERVTQGLCGRSRPGHFQGVTTIVLKLFQITQPDYAVFGEKDYQQLVVIKTMVRDLNLPVKILPGRIVREPDGLAMSSRNAYLSTAERELGLSLNRGLNKVKRACFKSRLSVKEMRRVFLSEISKSHKIKLDYFECVDSRTLNSINKHCPRRTLLAAAIFVGKTRLIDNLVV